MAKVDSMDRHPDFAAHWAANSGLVFWWSVRLRRIMNRGAGAARYTHRDFLGFLTLRFNYCLHMWKPDRGKFTTLFGLHMIEEAVDMLRKDSGREGFDPEWRERFRNEHMYRAPDEHDATWAGEVLDLFETPQYAWRYLTSGVPRRSADVLLWKFRDGKTHREIGELLGTCKQRVDQILQATLLCIRARLRPLEAFRKLFSAAE